MKYKLILVAAALFISTSAHAIDEKYRQKLERSGCTQVSEMEGCDINKTKAENAKAGFGTAEPAAADAGWSLQDCLPQWPHSRAAAIRPSLPERFGL